MSTRPSFSLPPAHYNNLEGNMSSSQSYHQRAWDSIQAARKIRKIADDHFQYMLDNGGTLEEVDEVATNFRTEIGFASVPFHAAKAQKARARAFPNMIHKYFTLGGKMEKS